jgi:hypothetical protein
VRASVEDVQVRVHAGFAQLAVHPHRVGQEQIPGAADDQGGREAREIPEQRREVQVMQVMPVGVQQVHVVQWLQSNADARECGEAVPGFGEIDFRGEKDEGGRHRQAFRLRAQQQGCGEIAAGGPAAPTGAFAEVIT